MASHSSASVREHTPRIINSVRNNKLNQTQISDVLRKRAESVINDKATDAESRAIIRYALEINDPMLAELVQWADAGESIVDNLAAQDESENDPPEQRVEALAEMICQGDDPGTRAVALLVLMASMETVDDYSSLAKTIKHCAFTRCCELNVFGMVDAQIEMLEQELFAHHSHLS
ncbi:MAG TPA: hypothetical protein VFI24_07825 [Pyrinomonadaceae bacterium]|nr:hypothetical protein [Pyrinomonadaceae bacterium]